MRVFFALFIFLLVIASLAYSQTTIDEPGIPLNGQVEKGSWVYYSVNLNVLGDLSEDDHVSFMLTSLSGDADLHVSITGNPDGPPCTNCIFSEDSPFSEVQTLKKDTPGKWPEAGKPFYIGVYGYTKASFTFNVWVSTKHVTLFDGQPQQAVLVSGQYTYFTYEIQEADFSNFSITVTPSYGGDPDIFVSTQTDKPSRETHEWSAEKYGFDIVNIQHSPDVHPGSKYYIGIYAFVDTHFTILVRDDRTDARIVEGHTMSDLVEQGEMLYYVYENLVQQRISISVEPFATQGGDPDLFVKFGSRPGTTPGSYDYSKRTTGDDSLMISHDDSKVGFYYIGIYGYAVDTKYKLVLKTEEKNTQLDDGATVSGSLNAGEVDYYVFNNGDAFVNIMATLEILSGQVDLYSGKHSRPGPEKHDKKGFEISSSQLAIQYHSPTDATKYYFAVHASANANYRLSLSTNQTVTYLSESRLNFDNYVPAGYYRHFIYEAPNFDNQDVSITVYPYSGDVDLFVSTEYKFPNRQNYTWFSDNWSQDTVVIQSQDPKANGKKLFYISVYGFREHNYFSIIASQSNSTTKLTDGATVGGVVQEGKYTYYAFNVAGYSTIELNVHITSNGDEADVYWSRRNPKPSRQDNEGRSLSYGDEILTLETYSGTIYFGVFGTNSKNGNPITFTITVRTSFVTLYPSGTSYLIHVEKGQYVQFKSYIGSHIENFVVSATLVAGNTKLYIANNGSPANETNNVLINNDWPGNAQLVQHTDKEFKSGNWFFGVYGEEASDFYISLSGYPYGGWLKEGVPMTVQAPIDGTKMMYAFWIPYAKDESAKEDFELSIQIQNAGSVDIYTNQDYNVEPGPGESTNNSTGSGDRVMIFKKADLVYSRPLYISVYGTQGQKDKPTIQLNIARPSVQKFLGQDQPQIVATKANSYTYYKVINSVAGKDLTVHLESCTTNPSPYAYISATSEYPSANTPDTTPSSPFTAVPHEYIQTISRRAYAEDTFFVGIGGVGYDSSYALFVTSGVDSRPSVTDNKLVDASKDGQLVLGVPAATPSARKTEQFLVYSAFTVEITKDESETNFFTACGIFNFGTLAGQIGSNSGVNFPLTNINKDKKYMVNVIVSDSNGLTAVYHPSYIVNGKISDVPNPSGGPDVAGIIFGLLFAFLALALIGYIGGGIGYKYYKGHRGIEMIPNIDFWRMVFTCGRSQQYAIFDNERTVNTSGFGSTNATAKDQEQQPIQSGGYGSI
ncbi:hypothetical protein ABK040_015005 [Willaertia magna]